MSLCEAVKTMSTTEKRKVCDGLDASQFTSALSEKPRAELSLILRKLRNSDVAVVLKLAKILQETDLYELGHITGKQRQMRQKKTPVLEDEGGVDAEMCLFVGGGGCTAAEILFI